MKKYKLSAILFSIVAFLNVTGCSIDAVYHTETVPETYFDSQDKVWQRFYRPFTHWKYYMGENRFRFELKQLGTDEIIVPTRGTDWANNGDYVKFHDHNFDENTTSTDKAWSAITMGIAHSWDTIDDLTNFVDFEEFGFPEGTREGMFDQLRALAAFYYLEGLDFFGGMPLYSTVNTPAVARSTAKETFDFIEELLDMTIPTLPKRKQGEMGNGSIHQGTAVAFKIRLYFNAEAYIGKAMYEECAKLCEDLIAGKYGYYQLEGDWTKIFGFTNSTCDELIWALPSNNTRLTSWDEIHKVRNHYNFKDYVKNDQAEGWNGACLVPSLDPTGKPYEYKLGSPYSKFEDTDIRKQPYAYLGEGEYRGMFIVGKQVNPLDAEDDTIPEEEKAVCRGTKEYRGEVLTMVDQIARFSEVGEGKKYSSTSELPSNISTGEENSGIRLLKVSPVPSSTDRTLRFNAYIPEIRLAEIHYTLAECKMRLRQESEAASIINKIRERYFINDNDPNPVTAANLDKYRMLDEWMIEFIGEQRRRTDLIRWGVYHTEEWWAHKPTNNPNLTKYQLHIKTLSSNNLMEQNPK